jgi:hypothetical protein
VSGLDARGADVIEQPVIKSREGGAVASARPPAAENIDDAS